MIYLIKLLQWLTHKYFENEYRLQDKEAVRRWLFDSFADKGATGYLQTRELLILKNMARGLSHEHYWKNIGQREELALLLDEMKRSFELKKAQDAKGGGADEKGNNGDNGSS